MLWCLVWHSVHILHACIGGPALHIQKCFESGVGRLWVFGTGCFFLRNHFLGMSFPVTVSSCDLV